MPRVLISAGHTMMDPGAIYGDLREADLTRKIAPMVLDALSQSGLEIRPVPLDLPLPDRIQWINDSGFNAQTGDILVEIHINDADGNKRGLEIWYEGIGNNESEKLGVAMADSVVTEQGFFSNGVRSEQDHDLGSLRFLNATLPHASIVEVLFIDNAEDIQILKDDNRLRSIAQSLAKGIAKYCGKNLNGTDLAETEKPNFTDLVAKYSIKPSGKKKQPFGGFGMDPFNDDLDDLMPATPLTPTPEATLPQFDTMASPQVIPNNLPGSSATNSVNLNPTQQPAAQVSPAVNSFSSVPVQNSQPAVSNTPTFPTSAMTPPPGLGASTFMDREKRKKMIEDTYEKVIGVKPEDKDLNTYLNKGVSEAELLQKLVESEQHAGLIKAKTELEQIKKEQDSAQGKLTKLQATVRDMQEMIAQLNRLLVHKNQAIQEMEKTFSENKGLPSQVYQKLQEQKKDSLPANQNSANGVKLNPSVGDNVKRRFAKRFS